MHRIIVCLSCRAQSKPEPQGQVLLDRLAAALPGFAVSGTDCMSGCNRPGTLAFRAPGKAAYLFGDIDPLADPSEIIAFAHHYASLPDGWVTDARPFALLRKAAIARIPAAPVSLP